MIDIFLLLTPNIIPLYVLIGLGYIAGRWLDVHLKSMATVAIYIMAPMVNFGTILQLDFDAKYTALPLIIFAASATIGFVTYKLAHMRWKDSSANLIAMSSVTGNTGYFGLPIILALFKPEDAGIYLLMNAALILSELGLGYYFGARGHADVKGAIIKVLKLPVIHAVWIAVLLNLSGFEPPQIILRYTNYATGAWILLGMLLVGIALGTQKKIVLDFRLMKWLFTAKFLAWPAFAAAFILVDSLYIHAFDPVVYPMMVVFCSVPLAGNLVAFSANLNLHPERVAGAVLTSTFLALITIPGFLALYHLYENM